MTSPRPAAVLLVLAVALELAQLPLVRGVAAPGSVAAVVLPLAAAAVLWRGEPGVWVLPGLAFAATGGALATTGLPAVLPFALADGGLPGLLAGLAGLAHAALLPVALPGLRARLADDPVRSSVARLGASGAVVLAAAQVTDWAGLLLGRPGVGRLPAGPLVAAATWTVVLLGLATVLHAGRDRAAVLGVLAALVLVSVPTLGTVVALDRDGFGIGTGTWVQLAASLPLVAALLLAGRRGPPGPRPEHPPAPV